MQNYKLMLNLWSELSSILDHSKSAEDKENLPDKPLIGNTLGKLIKEIWKGGIKNGLERSSSQTDCEVCTSGKENGCPVLPNFVILRRRSSR